MKTSTKTILSIVAIIIAIIVIVIFVKTGILSPKTINVPVDQTETTVSGLSSPASTFSWRYESGAEDLDGLPKTIVYLDVIYDNGKVIAQKIDEIQGSCNDVDPSTDDADKVGNATKIQCYAAGLGEWYKVVKGDTTYEVHRKYFEEGSPDVEPVDFKYEKVAEIPLFQ